MNTIDSSSHYYFTSHWCWFLPHIWSPGEKRCSACSCSVSVYSTSVSSIYRLSCGHLLCHACLRRQSHPVTAVTPNRILCPTCRSPTPRGDIMRVHHWRMQQSNGLQKPDRKWWGLVSGWRRGSASDVAFTCCDCVELKMNGKKKIKAERINSYL